MPQTSKITEADVEIMKRAVAELNRHQHKYTVPVEWEYRQGKEPLWQSPFGYDEDGYPFRKVVTRLRCESCPDEISRGDK